jgi:hypothetical protein
MKDLLNEIIRLWWVQGGLEIKNPKSEASIKAEKDLMITPMIKNKLSQNQNHNQMVMLVIKINH